MNQAQINNDHPFWVWTFKGYDKQRKKWFKSNSPHLESLERYRKSLLAQPNRYEKIGECYSRRIDKPHEY